MPIWGADLRLMKEVDAAQVVEVQKNLDMLLKESHLILALKSGSTEAFSQIYDSYADRVYGFALLHTKSKAVAEDIVQETFLRLWTHREKLDIERNAESLLFLIARHLVVDAFRKQVHRVEFEDFLEYQECVDPSATPEEHLFFDDFLRRLHLAKAKLSCREREIYKLSREMNLSVREIATRLRLSPQTVKNNITTVLKKFRKDLLESELMLGAGLLLSLLL